MQLEIIEQKNNPLFKRKEIIGKITTEATPSKIETKKVLAEKLSVQQDTIAIQNILGRFGSKEVIIHARVYESKGDLEKSEPRKKKKKIIESETPEKSAPEKSDVSDNQSSENK